MLIKSVERLLAARKPSFLPTGTLWIALLAIPTAAREVLTPLLGKTVPFATFYPAVLLAGLLLPTRAAWSLWLISGLVAHYIFVPPRFALGVNSTVLIGLAVYYGSSALVVVTGAALRTAVTRLQMAKEREELRNGELLHRIKNVFALVQTIAFQAAKKPDATPDRVRAEIEGWLLAMSETANLLAGHEWQSCDLQQLVRAVLAPFMTKNKIAVDGDPCEITADGAEALTLCLHELATNAIKHGALSAPEGRVAVTWQRPAPGTNSCPIRWQESHGPVVKPPTKRGFGSRIIKAQRGLLSATVHFEPDGLRCDMEVRVIECH